MNTFEIFALVAAFAGLLGSIIPALPGPPLSWVGLLLLHINGSVGTDSLVVWGIVTIVVSVLDYMSPIWTTRMTGGHKAASSGAIIGLLIGLLIPPVGMILGSLLGAFIGELAVTDKGVWPAFKAGMGAFLGFILGTVLKITVSGLMAFYIVKGIF